MLRSTGFLPTSNFASAEPCDPSTMEPGEDDVAPDSPRSSHDSPISHSMAAHDDPLIISPRQGDDHFPFGDPFGFDSQHGGSSITTHSLPFRVNATQVHRDLSTDATAPPKQSVTEPATQLAANPSDRAIQSSIERLLSGWYYDSLEKYQTYYPELVEHITRLSRLPLYPYTAKASVDSTPSTLVRASLMGIPAEIRLQILKELLTSDRVVRLVGREFQWHPMQKKKICVKVLRVCRQLCNEGTSVLYGENIFDFGLLQRRPWFAKRLCVFTKKYLHLVRQIVMCYNAASEDMGFAKLIPTHRLDRSYIADVLSHFNITIGQLKLLAIGVQPYSADDRVSMSILARDRGPVANLELTTVDAWLEQKNRKLSTNLAQVVETMKNLRILGKREAERKVAVEWELQWLEWTWIVVDRHGD